MHVIHSRTEETGQLYLMQAIEAEVPLSEAFDRLELPKGIDEVAWEGFKGHAIYVAEGIEKEKRVGLDLPQVAKGETTKLTGYADKSGTELNNASSRRQDKFNGGTLTEGC